MNGAAARFFKLTASSAVLVTIAFVLTGRANKPVPHGISLVTDWTHQHVIFTHPTPEMARRFGDDPRYIQQIYRQEQVLRLPTPASDARLLSLSPLALRARDFAIKKSKGLWSQPVGTFGVSDGPGAGNYPAKFTFNDVVGTCAGAPGIPDYVVYSTGLAGSSTQADIVAYGNLYSTCSGPVPSVLWAYNTGGQVLTSPVLSYDGKQVAFVETNAGAGILVMVKWAAVGGGSVGAPGAISNVSTTAYKTCTAPCMTTVSLATKTGTPTDDTTSSVFYDYAADTGWIGGAGGWLHEVTGMFYGVPTEVNNGNLPAQLNSTPGVFLSSPVYDHVTDRVFVGDSAGFFYRLEPDDGVFVKSAQVDFGTGLVEAPLVDSFDGLVYVFSSSDGTTNCTGGAACSAVFQFISRFDPTVPADDPVEVTVGNSVVNGSGTPNPMYLGAFDYIYIRSEGPPTGNLYVCGNTGANPTLYQIPVTNGTVPVAGNAITQLAPATSTAACSPVSDVRNPDATGGTHEFVFLSAQNNGRPAACAADTGCVMNFLDTPWSGDTHWPLGQQILSSKLNIETVIVAGTSAATPPTWPTQAGTTVTDGSVTWMDQGRLTAVTPAAWAASHAYTLHQRILDSHNNIEIVTTAGLSGTTTPDWKIIAGQTTTDGLVVGGVTWTNASTNPVAALAVTGGTTGIIIDNTENVGSQIYFGTLANQAAGSGVAGGGLSCAEGAACAVQASQQTLQ
jgi:hypothetical protein